MTKFRKKGGFTLIELIVVMAILAILVAIGAPRFLGYTKDAAVTAMKADTRIIEQASYQYALKNDDVWPVGAEVSSLDAEVRAIIVKALTAKGVAAVAPSTTVDDVVGEMLTAKLFKSVDASKVQGFIRSTKNPIANYFIVDKGTTVSYANQLEGVVFYSTDLTGSDGTLFSGLYDNK